MTITGFPGHRSLNMATTDEKATEVIKAILMGLRFNHQSIIHYAWASKQAFSFEAITCLI